MNCATCRFWIRGEPWPPRAAFPGVSDGEGGWLYPPTPAEPERPSGVGNCRRHAPVVMAPSMTLNPDHPRTELPTTSECFGCGDYAAAEARAAKAKEDAQP